MEINISCCKLCPRKCQINRNTSLGFCKAPNNIKIAKYSLHHFEEPIISCENGSGTIFFSNCNLGCVFCQNYQISEEAYGYNITIDEFCNICLKLQEMGAHNINLVTPTMYVPWIIEGIKKAKTKGLSIPIIYNTSGYEELEVIKSLNGIVDIYMPDLKYKNDFYARKYSNCKNYFNYAKSAIEEMYKQVGKPQFKGNALVKGVLVRHLVLPGLINDSKEILKYLYENYKDNIYISIMNQYTPLRKLKYDNLNRTITNFEYDEVIDYAVKIGIKNAFIQIGETQKESFIPNFKD